MADNMINIKIQFAEIAKTDVKKLKNNAAKAFDESVRQPGKQAFDSVGEAGIKTMSNWKKALKEFDWSHPIRSSVNVIREMFSEFMEGLGPLGKILVGFIGLIGKAIFDLGEIQGDITQMFAQLADTGERMSRRVSNAMIDIAEVSMRTGASLREITDLYVQLGKQRVPVGDLKDLSQYAYLGGKALGVSANSLADMMAQLSVMGRLNRTEIKGIVNTFASIQSQVGLTEQEMSGLMQTVSKLTNYLGAMNATPRTIQNVADATARLSGLFGKLGIGADKANSFMERLFDPTRIGENAMLVTKMGIGMGNYMDMLHGGAVNSEQLVTGLYDAVQQIKQLNSQGAGGMMAAQNLAQMYGMDLTEALKFANMSMEDLRASMEPPKKSFIDQAAEGIAPFMEQLKRLGNIFMSVFAKVAAPIVEKLTALFEDFYRYWLSDGNEIIPMINQWTDAIINFIRNLDFSAIGDFFKGIIEGGKVVVNIIGWIIKNWPIVLAGFIALKFLPGLIGGIGTALGGMVGNMFNFGKAAQGAASGADALKSGLGGFLKMAGVAVVLLAIAGAIWILSQSLENFVKFKDGILPMIIALGALIGALALMSIISKAVGPGMLIAAAAIVIMAGAMWVLGQSLQSFADNQDAILPMIGTLLALVGALTLLAIIGTAFPPFAGVMMVVAQSLLMVGAAVFLVGLGIRLLADAFYIAMDALGLMNTNLVALANNADAIKKGVDILAPTLGGLALAVGALGLALWGSIGNINDFGKAMASIAEGLKSLDPAQINKIGQVTEGIAPKFKAAGEAINAMTEAIRDVGRAEGAGRALKEIGIGLTELAVALYVLGKSSNLINTIILLPALANSVSLLCQAAYYYGADTLKSVGEGFKFLGEGIKVLTEADPNRLKGLAGPMDEIGNSLPKWTEALKKGAVFLMSVKDVGEGFKFLAEGVATLTNLNLSAMRELAGENSPLVGVAKNIDILLQSMAETTRNKALFGNLKEVGEGFTELAVGIYVMAKAPIDAMASLGDNLSSMAPGIEKLLSALGGQAFASIIGDFQKIAKGFTELAKGILELTKLPTTKMKELAAGLDLLVGKDGKTGAIVVMLNCLGANSMSQFLGDAQKLATGFKIMTEGIFMLAMTPNLESVARGVNAMAGSISSWINALGENWVSTMLGDPRKTGEAFALVGEGIAVMGRIPVDNINALADAIPKMGTAVAGWIEALSRAGIGEIWNASQKVAGAFTTVMAALAGLATAVPGGGLSELSTNLVGIGVAVSMMIQSLGSNIIAGLLNTVGNVANAFKTLAEAIVLLAGASYRPDLSANLMALATPIKGFVDALGSGDFWKSITGGFQQMGQAMKDLGSGIKDMASADLNKLYDYSSTIKYFVREISGLEFRMGGADQFAKMGEGISGLSAVTGIQNLPAVGEGIKKLAEGITSLSYVNANIFSTISTNLSSLGGGLLTIVPTLNQLTGAGNLGILAANITNLATSILDYKNKVGDYVSTMSSQIRGLDQTVTGRVEVTPTISPADMGGVMANLTTSIQTAFGAEVAKLIVSFEAKIDQLIANQTNNHTESLATLGTIAYNTNETWKRLGH